MDTVSLYDKYHSEHNKKYMYNLITNLLQKEYSVDMSSNSMYNQFFETNFMNTFKDVETEDIKDLNKHLLDTQLDYYQNFISKHTSGETSKEGESSKEKINELKEDNSIVSDSSNGENSIIYSLQRIINFQQSNRYSYRIQNKIKKECQIEKVILPIEDNYLFALPVIIISFDNKHVELHLRGTMKLGREYGIYTPFYETTFPLDNDKIKITLNNQLSHERKGCDVYKIDSYDNGTIGITCDKGEFMIGDYIRVCNFGNIDIDDSTCLKNQYKIIGVNDKSISIENGSIIKKGLYIMNVSLQNSIHLSYG